MAAPRYLCVKSGVGGIGGGFVRAPADINRYPAYEKEGGGAWIWHAETAAGHHWFLSQEPKSTKALPIGKGDNVNVTQLKWPFLHPSGQPIIEEIVDASWREKASGTGSFQDETFASGKALGPELQHIDAEWIRISELHRQATATLFGTCIHPNQCYQGPDLGNCWLISAISAIAEFPAAIKRLFESIHVSMDGKYTIPLYDIRTSSWVDVTIDDRMACQTRPWWQPVAKPICAQLPPTDEGELPVWTLLLEKAIAKLAGSYSELHGGNIAWAWQALTGVEDLVTYHNGGSGWMKYRLRVEGQKEEMNSGLRFSTPWTPDREDVLQGEGFFEALSSWDKMHYCMCATIQSGAVSPEQAKAHGLVVCHGYSLISAVKVGGNRLIKLRNPWGHTEWTGAWSDGSAEWSQNLAAKKATGHTDEKDGVFWMCLEDFERFFDLIHLLPHEMKGERAPGAVKKVTERFTSCLVSDKLFVEARQSVEKEVKRTFEAWDANGDGSRCMPMSLLWQSFPAQVNTSCAG
eukprot:TRINITY_DN11630_c0_g1_i1.p1 TRINITY_DN11630_c0_g1~~TRINITY_DN11630_c0_g1_i1.p1  ORF type:complete len:519 (+),score=59.43 TRINITY_DN11630_c0_g1_i1:65-1621(+)